MQRDVRFRALVNPGFRRSRERTETTDRVLDSKGSSRMACV
jgi:hypothetical protein